MKDAINENVDMISLSLGFRYRTRALAPIDQAIRLASSRNILIFAAASNSGANENLAYPADQDQVIWIGAADGHGNKSPFTPSHSASSSTYHFIALGEGVRSSWPRSRGGPYQARSGTSYATAVAVGLAASVLDFMRFKLWNENPDSEERFLLDKMRRRMGMQKVLLSMANQTSDGYHNLAPWKLFDSYSESRSDEVKDQLKRLLEKV